MKTEIFNLLRIFNKIPAVENALVELSVNGNKFARKIIGSEKLYNTGTLRTCTRNDLNYALDISDYVDHCIYFGFNDIADLDRSYLKQIVKKDDIVFDIGANIGDTVLHFAKFLNNTGRIYAFEPLPHIFQRLTQNVGLNSFTNISIYNHAMGNVNSSLVAHVDKNHSGGTFIQQHATDGVPVKIRTLDSFVEENDIPQIDLIKIDTEGFEDHVLAGASETITRLKPKLFIELNDQHLKRAGSSAIQLVQRLLNWGYVITRTDSLESIRENYPFAQQHFDILCLPSAN